MSVEIDLDRRGKCVRESGVEFWFVGDGDATGDFKHKFVLT